MSTDYDTLRAAADEPTREVLEMTQPRRAGEAQALRIDELDPPVDPSEELSLWQDGLGEAEAAVVILPQQEDEFVCESCFLITHRSQLAPGAGGGQICRGCAG